LSAIIKYFRKREIGKKRKKTRGKRVVNVELEGGDLWKERMDSLIYCFVPKSSDDYGDV